MTDWIVLGEHINTWGERLPVGLPMHDLQVHTSVFGTTGSGKSTLLRNLALQAFALGASVIVVEPHGDLILDPEEGILASISPADLGRVTVVDLNSLWPPQINLATAGLGAGRSAAVNMVMGCVRTIEEASWTGAVRMREILEHSLHLLLHVYGRETGMIYLQRFLLDPAFRLNTLKNAGETVAESKTYWQRMQESFDRSRDGGEAIIEVPLRRVGGFLRDERFRRSLSLPDLGAGLNLAHLMQQPGQMILVPLQASALGEQVKKVFGTLFMQLVSNAFMARASQDKKDRQQTLIIIDEFADLAGGDIGTLVNELLAQARKFGASVVLATQAPHQLPPDVKGEVKSNTNNKIVLLTSSPDDANEATKNLAHKGLTADDVMAIEKFHGYARLMVNKSPQPTFYFKALPPLNFADKQSDQDNRGNLPPFPGDLSALNALHQLPPLEAIDSLVCTPPDEFQRLINLQVEAGHFAADQLLAHPHLEPDPVQLALKISRSRHGLPWWMYEAFYRRLRF